jgi:dUTP pyrophosphatase
LINFGSENFEIVRGMRIAQMVIAKFEKVKWNFVEELSPTVRGASGFGSTGQ